MHLILSSDNTNPWHQDIQTGSKVYDLSYKLDSDKEIRSLGKRYLRPAHGIRVLIDLGSLNGKHDSRLFKFKEQKRNGESVEIFKTKSRVIAMNAGAAGSGGKNQIYHGRFGDGVTIQLDLILNKSHGKIRGKAIRGKAKKVGVGGVINTWIKKYVINKYNKWMIIFNTSLRMLHCI